MWGKIFSDIFAYCTQALVFILYAFLISGTPDIYLTIYLPPQNKNKIHEMDFLGKRERKLWKGWLITQMSSVEVNANSFFSSL